MKANEVIWCFEKFRRSVRKLSIFCGEKKLKHAQAVNKTRTLKRSKIKRIKPLVLVQTRQRQEIQALDNQIVYRTESTQGETEKKEGKKTQDGNVSQSCKIMERERERERSITNILSRVGSFHSVQEICVAKQV